MEIGTPKEDASRRDLTINALFYNVNTNYIEDFTCTGLKDLEEKIVRTPLAAFKTLEDDPLRALRAIRFACRFNFKMEEELVKSCGDPRVHEALKNKVSYERINTEFDAMMIHPLASKAIVMLYEMGLIKLVFPVPSNDEIQLKPDTKDSHSIDSLKDFHAHGVAMNLLADILKREQSFIKGLHIYLSIYLNNTLTYYTVIDNSGEDAKILRIGCLSKGSAAFLSKHPTKSKKIVSLSERILLLGIYNATIMIINIIIRIIRFKDEK